RLRVLVLDRAGRAAQVADEDGRLETLPLAEELRHRVVTDRRRILHEVRARRLVRVPGEAPPIRLIPLLLGREGAQRDGGRRGGVEREREEPRKLMLAPAFGGVCRRRGRRRWARTSLRPVRAKRGRGELGGARGGFAPSL